MTEGKLLSELFLDKDIKTPVCFFDETGVLHNEVDKFFILGMIKSLRPHKLAGYIRGLRDKNHFYDEIKWKKVNAKNLDIMKLLTDQFLVCSNTSFFCVVLDKAHMDFEKYFQNDFFRVYKSFTVLLLKKCILPDEIACVVADHYSTPKDDEFEAKVRNFVNDHNKKLSVHSIIRIHSKGSDIVQLADLLMGAVNYDFKLKFKLLSSPSRAKMELLEYIKSKLMVTSLAVRLKTEKFNIIIFDPALKKNL